MGGAARAESMPATQRAVGRIGTFEGRAGNRDRAGRLALADAVAELAVADDRSDPETGERTVELTLRADFSANAVEVRLERPEHGPAPGRPPTG